MNKEWIHFHLTEALEELNRTINELSNDPDYGIGDFSVGMQHIFHHLNTAWNSRDVSPKKASESSDKDFNAWRQFPKDIDMSAE